MRGGTSKGLFFHQKDLPEDPTLRDQVIQRVYGSPDSFGRQIDGVGGATSTTSKTAIIAPSSRPDADVDYTFGQVGIKTALIDYRGNCGNLSSAVGPFAIDEGLVRAQEPVTTVRIHNTNTQKLIIAHVPVEGGRAAIDGDYAIDGIPGMAARIELEYLDPSGAVTGKLLPTGNARDHLAVGALGTVEVSIVDAANPLVFVPAWALGLRGTELPDEIDGDADLLRRLEAIRAAAAARIGLVGSPEEATRRSPAVPKIAVVAAPAPYATISGHRVDVSAVDIIARIQSMGFCHRAFALTGAICTAVAATVPDTVVNAVVRDPKRRERAVRLGHPSGILEVGVHAVQRDGAWQIDRVIASRTARRLMAGEVYVPASLFAASPRMPARR
jgi:2-methylaconitate cis-trans-isomerase PrpF